jgi:hypothetical protein
MPLSSDELMKRGDDRLQQIYDAIERGEPVDFRKYAALEALEIVQLGRAFEQETIEAHRVEDEKFRNS